MLHIHHTPTQHSLHSQSFHELRLHEASTCIKLSTVSAGTCCSIQSVSFSLLLSENTNKRHSGIKVIIPQCCTHPLEQAAKRHAPQSRKHRVFLVAAKIIFGFAFLVTQWSPHTTSCIPFSIIFAKHNECVAVYKVLNCTIQVDIDVPRKSCIV